MGWSSAKHLRTQVEINPPWWLFHLPHGYNICHTLNAICNIITIQDINICQSRHNISLHQIGINICQYKYNGYSICHVPLRLIILGNKSNMTLVAYHLPHIGITSAYSTMVHIKPLTKQKTNLQFFANRKTTLPQWHQLNSEGQHFLQTWRSHVGY